MTQHDDGSRLHHMLDSAQKAVEFTKGKDRGSLDSDEQLALSLTRLLEIIGEAAKNVSSDLRKNHPDIPWRDIAGMRDRLSHGYFDVDYNVIWQIVSVDLPPLIIRLKKLVA